MEKVWFTADTHFNHINILKHCKRPFNNIEEMNNYIIDNWNKAVNKHDRVYILGDFAFSEHDKFFNKLNGFKHLIVGNHDSMAASILNKFESVSEIKEIKIENRLFILSHFPLRTWSECLYGSIHLFGHVHGRIKTENLSFDVGVDTNNFKLYSYEDIMEKVKERESMMKKVHRIVESVKNNRKVFQYYQDDLQYYQFIIDKMKGIK